MDTQVRKLDYDNIDPEIMKEAGDIIRAGGLVAFPTETVYGLGGDALNPRSSMKIDAAKGCPADNRKIVHSQGTSLGQSPDCTHRRTGGSV